MSLSVITKDGEVDDIGAVKVAETRTEQAIYTLEEIDREIAVLEGQLMVLKEYQEKLNSLKGLRQSILAEAGKVKLKEKQGPRE